MSNVLLIDDDSLSLKALRHHVEVGLRKHGTRLFYCRSIADGIREAEADRTISLVLLDLGMPCVTGPDETLEFIDRFPCNVAVYTAHDADQYRQLASDKGAIGFISKNDRIEDQIAAIRAILEQINSAQIRTKTESQNGFALHKSAKPSVLAIIALVITALGFVGGALAYTLSVGGWKQGVDGHFKTLDKDVGELKQGVNHNNAVMHRLDMRSALIMQKLGIKEPADIQNEPPEDRGDE